jgi:hypothetical protein
MQTSEQMTFDRTQDKADAAWERVQPRIDWRMVEAHFVEAVGQALRQPYHPLRKLVDTLKDVPVIDQFDVDGWCESARLRDLAALGKSVMRLLGDAQLVDVSRLLAQDDDRPF